MRIRPIVVILIVTTVLVFAPAPWLKADQQGAWAASLQAVGVVASILIAAGSLRIGAEALASDRRDRQVDRVLALHEELTTGPTGEARSRLSRFLRSHGPDVNRARQVSRAQLRDTNADVNTYDDPDEAQISTPSHDLTRILRLFERVRIAHAAGSLDDLMMVALIGRHAGWWDLAIARDSETARVPLERLADWCKKYQQRHASEPLLEGWGDARGKAFPGGPVTEAALPPRPPKPATS